MLLKQMKNPTSSLYVWKDETGKVCGCMVGQVVIALHPEIKDVGKLNDKAIDICSEITGTYCITSFSDGRRRFKESLYRKVCKIFREAYPKLKLRFPSWESYKPC